MSKIRVAILGGGLSGLVTAYNLSAPEQQGKYDITIYQLGWRLGGKCATGRNADENDRIQEHGLHVFMGAYENAFHLVQGIYAEASNPPFRTWEEAFTQVSALTLMDRSAGTYEPWVMQTPIMPGTPGIDPAPDIWERMQQVLEWIEREILGVHTETFGGATNPAHLPWWKRLFYRLLHGMELAAVHAATILIRDGLDLLGTLISDPSTHGPREHSLLAGLFEGLRSWMARRARPLLEHDQELRRFWILVDLALTSVIGGLRDGLLFAPLANLERVNALDYKEWLRLHGANELTIDSAIVRGLYDLIFAYPQGNWRGEGEVEAGTMFLSLMGTATYQGSIVWKFNTATGDLVAQPMYEVLIARGVKVNFFHRVDRLVPSADGSEIAAVEIGRQVELAAERYNPLRTLPSGQQVWPDRPLYDQIKDGAVLADSGADLESHWTDWSDTGKALTLKAGADYDALVLAIPPAAHPTICRDLIKQKSVWRNFIGSIRTTATQSLQTWMGEDEARLGWHNPSLVGAYDKVNLNSWCDISEAMATESWPKESGVKSEQIFCGPLPCSDTLPASSEHQYPARQQSVVDEGAALFLKRDGIHFWKNRFGVDGPEAGTVLSQYSRANIDPSERYTLTVKNSTKYRMTAGGSTYANLYLTGDWIQNGQNLGSFEATTISGMLASHALSKFPKDIRGVDAKTLTKSEYPPNSSATPGRYVPHGGMTTFSGPISLKDTTMWAFLLEAEYSRMEEYCRRMFDQPSAGAVKVRPMTSLMMMTVVDIGQGRFVDEPLMGWSRERELTFWIPAVRVEDRGGRLVATHLDLVLPYLVLDNPVAIASGREIFGYAKQKGWLTLPEDDGNASGQIAIDLFATKTFGSDAREQRHRLMTLQPVDERNHARLAELDNFGDAARELLRHMQEKRSGWHNSLTLDLEMLGNVLNRRVPQLFLKQFRDVSDGRNACYQAITEVTGEVTRFEAFPKLVEYDMVLDQLDSSPVAREFGIEPAQRLLGAKFAYDMTINPGQVLWQA